MAGDAGAGDEPELVAGRNAVVEALRAAVPATALYVARGWTTTSGWKRRSRWPRTRHAVLEVGRAKLDRLSEGAIHQGLALQIRRYEYAHPDDLVGRGRDAGQAPLIVALDRVTDPRNLGAIVRSAAAFGAHGVVIPARRSAGVTAGAWKTSAGRAAPVPVARAANLTATLGAYRGGGPVRGRPGRRGTVGAADLEVAVEPLVIVVGSEGKGLSRLVASRATWSSGSR